MNAQIVMDSLRRIHEEDGRLVICNLYTLDIARKYCDRIVFDGTGAELTADAAREIYGADESFSESATSTSVETLAQTNHKLNELA